MNDTCRQCGFKGVLLIHDFCQSCATMSYGQRSRSEAIYEMGFAQPVAYVHEFDPPVTLGAGDSFSFTTTISDQAPIFEGAADAMKYATQAMTDFGSTMREVTRQVDQARKLREQGTRARLAKILATNPELGALAPVLAREPACIEMHPADVQWLKEILGRTEPITKFVVGDGSFPPIDVLATYAGTTLVEDPTLEAGTVRVKEKWHTSDPNPGTMLVVIR